MVFSVQFVVNIKGLSRFFAVIPAGPEGRMNVKSHWIKNHLTALLIAAAGCGYSFAQTTAQPTPRPVSTPPPPSSISLRSRVPIGSNPPITPDTKNPLETVRVSAYEGDAPVRQNLWRPAIEDVARPSKEQKKRFAEFLDGEQTGLVKIFPAENTITISAKGEQRPVPQDCSFYSFGRKVHMRQIADLRLVNGLFMTGVAQASIGAFVAPGDMRLEDITAETPVVKKLLARKMPTTPENFVAQKLKTPQSVRAAAGQTYIMRSVVYGWWDYTVAFKVIEKDTDGSFLILWKVLEKGSPPKVED